MLIAMRFFAGRDINGNSKRLIIIQDSNNYSGNLHKVIKYSVNCSFECDFFCGEYEITAKEYKNIIKQAKALNILELGE